MKPIKLDIKKMGACVLSTSLVMSTAQTLLSNFSLNLNSPFFAFGARETLGASNESITINPATNTTDSFYFNLSRGIDTSNGDLDISYVGNVDGFSKKAIEEIADQGYSDVSLAFPDKINFVNLVDDTPQTYSIKSISPHAFDAEMSEKEFEIYILNSPSNLRIAGQKDSGDVLTAEDYTKYIAACKKIKKLVFSDDDADLPEITSIGSYAFRGCFSSDNVSIAFSSGLIGIGTGAFSNCECLTEVKIPKTVTTISDFAFKDCVNLSKVTLGNGQISTGGVSQTIGVEYIGNEAFAGCKALETLTLPESVRSLGSKVFAHSGLKKISIPREITEIPNFAFAACSNLTEVTLGDIGATTIGDNAFSGCTALEAIQFPSTLETIGQNAFGPYMQTTDTDTNPNQNEIDSLTNELNTLKAQKLQLETNTLNNLADETPNTDNERFSTFTSEEFRQKLSSSSQLDALLNWLSYYAKIIEINSTISTLTDNIPETIASACTSLTSVTFKTFLGQSNIQHIKSGAFKNCSSLNNIDLTVCKLLETIDDSAFEECSALSSISLPASLETLGVAVFSKCSSLSNVEFGSGIENLKTIPKNAFSYCKNLTTIHIPKCVTTIDGSFHEEPGYIFANGAFAYSGLRSITFTADSSAQLQIIGPATFYGCNYLANITIPETVEDIQEHAFDKCSALSSVSFDFVQSNGTNSRKAALKTIGDGAFANTTLLKEIVIPSTVKKIGEYVFKKSGLTKISFADGQTELIDHTITSWSFADCQNLTYFEFPDSITTIQGNAFSNCKQLKTLKYPLMIKTVAQNAFVNCPIKYAILPQTLAQGFSDKGAYGANTQVLEVKNQIITENNITYELDVSKANSDSESPFGLCATVLGFVDNEADSHLNIEDTITLSINGYYQPSSIPVKKINESAFSNCKHLTQVSIPNTIVEIGKSAFEGCTNLATINIRHTPDEPSNLSIVADSAFKNCFSLKTIPSEVFEKLTSIGNFSFYNCPLTSVTISETTSSIGDYAFAHEDLGADDRKVIADNLKQEFGENFKDYMVPGTSSQIARITIDGNGKALTIGNNAFYGAFEWYPTTTYNNNTMSSATLTIPSRVTSIGEKAFYSLSSSGCKEITIKGNGSITIGDEAFANATGCERITLNNVNSMGTSAFAGASECETITLSDVNSIGTSAFAGASECETITLSNVNSIGDHAFEGANECETLKISGPTTIGDYAFYHTDVFEISDLTLEGVTSIGAYAFAVDPDIKDAKQDLYPKIELSDSITYVGEGAFSNIPQIQHIFFKKDPKDITFAKDAFDDKLDASKIRFKTMSKIINNTQNGITATYTYNLSEWDTYTNTEVPADFATLAGVTVTDASGKAVALTGIGNDTSYKIPALINHSASGKNITYNVTHIGSGAFKNQTSLTTVNLPDNITNIDSQAFMGCSALTSISLPATIRYIGAQAFSYTGLESATLPFYDAVNPTTFTCEFEPEIFSYCNNLKSVAFLGFKDYNMKLVLDDNTKINGMFKGSGNVHLYLTDNFFTSNGGVLISKTNIGTLLSVNNVNIHIANSNNKNENWVSTVTDAEEKLIAAVEQKTKEEAIDIDNTNGYGGQGMGFDSESGETASARLFENVTTKSLETDAKLSDLKINTIITSPLTKILNALGDTAISYVSEIIGQLPTPPSFTLSSGCLGKTAYITFISSSGEVATKDPTDPTKTIWLTKEEVEKLGKEDYEKLAYQKVENLKNPTFRIYSSGSIYAIVTIK